MEKDAGCNPVTCCYCRNSMLYCRLTNIGNTSLSLDDITFDYWFNGLEDGSSISVDQFRPVCSDATIGTVFYS